MKFFLPFLTIAIVGIVSMYLFMLKPEPELREPSEISVPVEYILVEFQDLRLRVNSQGVLQPRFESTIAAEVAGRVVAVSDQLINGGFVEKGDILLTIDPVNYEVALAEAQAGLLSAQTSMEQARADAEQALRDLSDVGIDQPTALARREPQLLQAKATLESAKANLLLAETNLLRTKISAPYSGQLRDVVLQLGDVVAGPGTPAAGIYSTGLGEVRLPLSLAELQLLQLPDTPTSIQKAPQEKPQVRFLLSHGKADRYRVGWVDRLEGTVDPISRLRYAVARIEEPLFPPNSGALSFPFGSFLRAEIEGIAVENAVILPEEALIGRDRVRVIDKDNRLQERSINVVQRRNGTAIVSSGLDRGDRVCLTSVYPFTPGMSVLPALRQEKGTSNKINLR